MSLTMEALLQKPDFVKEVILSEKAYKNSQLDHLLDLCKKHNIKIVYDDKTIDKLSIKENCYCIGVFDKFYFKPEGRRHIVLYGFNDYGELGIHCCHRANEYTDGTTKYECELFMENDKYEDIDGYIDDEKRDNSNYKDIKIDCFQKYINYNLILLIAFLFAIN